MTSQAKWSTRQKIVLVLTIIVFAVLVWQIYSLVKGDVVVKKTPAVNSLQQHANSSARMKHAAVGVSNNQSSVSQITSHNFDHPQVVSKLPQEVIQRRPNLGMDQQQYVKIANQFELAKMQRQLLEEQVAIANARHNIAQTQQKTRDITGGGDGDVLGVEDGSSHQVSMRLTYLSKDGGRWHATIYRNGRYHNVVSGDELGDGAKVLAVNNNGVKLQYNGIPSLLTFDGSLAVKTALVKASPTKQAVKLTTAARTQAPAKTPAVPASAIPAITITSHSADATIAKPQPQSSTKVVVTTAATKTSSVDTSAKEANVQPQSSDKIAEVSKATATTSTAANATASKAEPQLQNNGNTPTANNTIKTAASASSQAKPVLPANVIFSKEQHQTAAAANTPDGNGVFAMPQQPATTTPATSVAATTPSTDQAKTPS